MSKGEYMEEREEIIGEITEEDIKRIEIEKLKKLEANGWNIYSLDDPKTWEGV